MSTSRSDRWTALNTSRAVRDAADRLRQLSATASERDARRHWLVLLDLRDGERAVDIGAGIGDMTVDIARHVGPDGAVHALDLSPGLLHHTRQRAAEAGVLDRVATDTGDANALPYGDDAFDVALCRWVLLHLPAPQRAIAEMRRVVRPGGRVLCVEADWETLIVHPGDPDVTRRIAHANVERQVDGRIGRKLAPLLQSAGFSNVSVTPLVDLDRSGDWLPFLHTRLDVAAQAGVPLSTLHQWWKAIESAASHGEYLFSFTQYGVLGIVPPVSQPARAESPT
ncbi:methyltransferase domain-containing protein [Aquisalimonas sp.]|uniref:methyltransferase domain-containing protein n=1 Tax=Aquisalimonas sp. TaxID=1872621 RepID=UPI0025BEC54D|nr:methyltransferase domain-containing protein [Aquisalimonas sp.]